MDNVREHLLSGHVIPALPLALRADGSWSERHERALVRYYIDAGAGGIAAGVHSTQFAIRDPRHGLFRPVLECAAEEIRSWSRARGRAVATIGGVCGTTEQACAEVGFLRDTGYDAALVSLAALGDASEANLLDHCREVAGRIPILGFYLQPAVGGRWLSHGFWRAFFEIESVVGVKIAPFNRYATWDVVRAALDSGRDDVALYTGNDDQIVIDLLTRWEWQGKSLFLAGGLLGHWGVWTEAAVRLLRRIREARRAPSLDPAWLTIQQRMTDMNAAVFDAGHGFRGCVPGIMDVLRLQGLVPSARTLEPRECLSPGQAGEIARVRAAYPEWVDDAFVRERLEEWLSE